MRITNLRKAIAASLMASGLVCGSTAYAETINHVVGDPSFDDTPVAASGYSYFNGPPDSAWESDGTWWYNTDYATNTSPIRPDPRTGDQAAHGFGSYNWQALDDTFEAGRTYTLSVYAGGDSDATGPTDGSDRSWLYVYDGDATPDLVDTFFDPDSLVSAFYDRDGSFDVFTGNGTGKNAGWTIGGGNEWGLISVSYTATADVDGRPIGVAFYGRGDAALDDVSLTSVSELSTVILDVNRVNGQMAISAGSADMDINAYEITSVSNSLNPSGWLAGNLGARDVDAVEDPNGPTPGPGNDPGETWQAFDASDGRLTEAFLLGSSLFGGGSGRTESIGSGYDAGQDAQDLVFMVTTTGGDTVSAFINYFESGVLLGDVNLDGVVNGLDVDPFVDVLLNGPFQAEADMNVDKVVNGLDVDPFVAAVVGGGAAAVPEPATFALLAVAVTLVGFGWFVRRQR